MRGRSSMVPRRIFGAPWSVTPLTISDLRVAVVTRRFILRLHCRSSMRSQRRAVWVGCAAIALALAGCGSITPLESADGGTVSPPRLTRSDAGRISIETADAGPSTVETNDADPLPPPTKDAGAPMAEPKDAGNGPSPARDAGAPMPDTKDAGKGANNSSCGAKGNCSNGLVCNPASGLCVECLVNDDCGGKTKLCDLATLTCLQCASGDDCEG